VGDRLTRAVLRRIHPLADTICARASLCSKRLNTTRWTMESQTRRRQLGTYSGALLAQAISEGATHEEDLAYAFLVLLDDPDLQEVVREFQVAAAEKAE
jgi:hypothetical protein